MTGLYLADLLLESADGLAIVAGSNRCDSCIERTCCLDAPGLHVFEKFGPDFRLSDQIENCLCLDLVYCASVSVVIVPDDHDVEDVAGDISAQEGIGAADRLHVGFSARPVRQGRHEEIFKVAARQVLQAAADQDAAAPPWFVR